MVGGAVCSEFDEQPDKGNVNGNVKAIVKASKTMLLENTR